MAGRSGESNQGLPNRERVSFVVAEQLALDGKEPLIPGYSFELVLSLVLDLDPRGRDEVGYGAGYQNLVRPGVRGTR